MIENCQYCSVPCPIDRNCSNVIFIFVATFASSGRCAFCNRGAKRTIEDSPIVIDERAQRLNTVADALLSTFFFPLRLARRRIFCPRGQRSRSRGALCIREPPGKHSARRHSPLDCRPKLYLMFV